MCFFLFLFFSSYIIYRTLPTNLTYKITEGKHVKFPEEAVEQKTYSTIGLNISIFNVLKAHNLWIALQITIMNPLP